MLKKCDLHGTYTSESVVVFGHVIAQSGCPECEKEAAIKEQKEKEKEYRESYPRRGIEPEFYEATLENYKAETPSEKEALQAVEELKDGKIKKVVLLGANGTGKTHLASAIVKDLRGIRITMFELSARIRAGFNEGYGEIATLNELLTYPVIVIDEVGRTKGSESERNWMSYLIDKAHTRGIRLLLISNRQTAKSLPPERRGEAFEFYFDNDVISRLRQDSKVVEVKGRDRRAADCQMANTKAAKSAV